MKTKQTLILCFTVITVAEIIYMHSLWSFVLWFALAIAYDQKHEIGDRPYGFKPGDYQP